MDSMEKCYASQQRESVAEVESISRVVVLHINNREPFCTSAL